VPLYLHVARTAAQRQLAYRQANLAGFLTNLFFGLLRAYVMIALYQVKGGQPDIAGYSLISAITYTGLTQAFIGAVRIFGWWDLMRTIKSGDVVSDMSKPFDFYFFWMAQDFGANAVHILTRSLPIMLAYALFFQFVGPATLGVALAFILSLLLAMFASFAWRFIVNIIALWTVDALGVGRLMYTISIFFSGFLVPVAFFPDWLKTIAYLTPFPAMIETPVQIYLGILQGQAIAPALLTQALWFVALYAVGRWLLAAGVRKLVIQGG
jgi:ABC-2 type transport system permease protein